MILYPTETLYALGVNALSETECQKLFELKERESGKASSWLVRSIADIERYAGVSAVARTIAEHFLPGELTLILPAKDTVPLFRRGKENEVSFRISADPKAQELISDFMEKHDAPLTCTSANVSGSPTLSTPSEILQQFGPKANMIDEIIDDGPRKGLASTVVRVMGDEYTVLREGEISEWDIKKVLMAAGHL